MTDDPEPEFTAQTMLDAARAIYEKYGDQPIALKMSRETYRRLIVGLNIPQGEEPMRLYGMPIIFDNKTPDGYIRKEFQ